MKNEPIIPVGFEKTFLKSYKGWDEVDPLVYQFYDCVLVDSLKKFQKENTTVCVDLDNCVVQICDDEGENSAVEIPFSLNMDLTKED